MRILWLSTIPSQPAKTKKQIFINRLAQQLREMCEDLFFVYCGSAGLSASKYREMKEFWPKFLYLPLLPTQVTSIWELDLNKFKTALELVAEDYDVIVFNYLFLAPAVRPVSKDKFVVCLPLLEDTSGANEYLTVLQQQWFDNLNLNIEDKTLLFQGINLLITRTNAEKAALARIMPEEDDIAFVPEILLDSTLQGEKSNSFYSIISTRSKKALLFLDYPFWDVQWGGYAQYLWILIKYLNKKYRLNIVYRDTWERNYQARVMVNKLGLENKFIYLSNYLAASDALPDAPIVNYPASIAQNYNGDQYKAFTHYLMTSQHFDLIMTVGILNSFFIEAVPYQTLKILNIPDLWALRHYIFKGHENNKISTAEEMAICDRYDFTVLIEQSEADYVHHNSEKTIPVCCPFCFPGKILSMPTHGIHFGFIAPEHIYEPIEWFLTNVWPFQDRPDARLHLFGNICKRFAKAPPKTILHSVVESEEEIHTYCHVMLNPAILATGMSTKTVMALAYGRPVLATPRGARGFEKIPNSGIYTAYSRQEFIEAMWLFSHDLAFLQKYADAACKTAQTYVAMENSFKNLDNLLESY